MRITIKADSATEKQLRQLLFAVAKIGEPGTVKVGLNGPSHYSMKTEPLSENQFARVVARLVTVDGEPVITALDM